MKRNDPKDPIAAVSAARSKAPALVRPSLPPPARAEAPEQPLDGLSKGRTGDLEIYRAHHGLLSGVAPEAPAEERAVAPPGGAPFGIPISQLEPIAAQAMRSRGLVTELPADALQQAASIAAPTLPRDPTIRDLRDLPWCSIDNDDSKDLDQLALAERLPGGRIRLRVAIADVDGLVPRDSAIDRHAQRNTATVYTPGHVYSMIPPELSTGATSLNAGEDRLAVVTEMILDEHGNVESSDVYQALVHNHAKLAYNGVSDWLEDKGPVPRAIQESGGMDEQVRLQLEAGQRLAAANQRRGGLEFETDRVLTVVEDGRIVDLVSEEKNVANEMVAQMMIAANIENAKFLHERGFPLLQRVVPPPERWDRMREIAVQAAGKLPAGKELPSEIAILPPEPDSARLAEFLRRYQEASPQGYSDLALSMVKLMGGARYVVTAPGEPLRGHFGLGVAGERGYLHSTAPNRRYPDLVIQRLLKAAVRTEPVPYTLDELERLAERCNQQQSAGRAAERQVRKSAVAMFLTTQIGHEYQALVTGENKKGTFVRVVDPPIEGKLVEGAAQVDVGDRIAVRLQAVDVEQGHIDFGRSDVPEQELPAEGLVLAR